MPEKAKKLQKEEIYKAWNFTVSAYKFEIPNGQRAGTVLNLVELKTVKKKWSEETGSYYSQSQYITISEDQLVNLVEAVRM